VNVEQMTQMEGLWHMAWTVFLLIVMAYAWLIVLDIRSHHHKCRHCRRFRA
jgi:hypothetical protein